MGGRRVEVRGKHDEGDIGKTVGAYIARCEEATLSRLLVETAILLAASWTNATAVLRDAASTYKIDSEAITLKVKQEFAARESKKSNQLAARPKKKTAA